MVWTAVKAKIDSFFAQYTPQKFKKRSVIIDPHEPLKGVYFLKSGYIREYSISPDGVELTLHIFKPGSYFPMTWVIGNIKNRYFYEAATDIEIVIAPKEKILNFLKADNQVLLELTSRLLAGMDKLLFRVEHMASATAHKKVLSSLQFLARHFGVKKEDGVHFSLNFTHQDIAAFAGLTRETTSRELEKLQKEGTIQQKKKLIITSLDNLAASLNQG